MVWERNQELVGMGYGMGEEPRDGNQEIRTRAGEETERWEPEDMNHVRGEERWDGSQKI